MFARTVITTLAGPALVAGALGLVALANPGTAGALSSTDDTFLSDIQAEGITYSSTREVVGVAHDVCLALDDGTDPVDLGMEILEATDLSTHQVATFVVSAVSNYCPEYGVLFE